MADELMDQAVDSATDATIEVLKEKYEEFNQLYNQLVDIANILKIKPEDTQALRDAYHLIMQIRTFFTGEAIEYIIYITGQDLTEKPIVKRIQDDQLSIKGSSGNLRLGNSKYTAIETVETQAQAIVDRHWESIMKSFVLVENNTDAGIQKLYKASKKILDAYGAINQQLYYQRGGSSELSEAWFNKGQISEAFFITGKNVYPKEGVKINRYYQTFEKAYFGKYLKKDSEHGFNSGDYQNLQIKALNAQIMAGSTVRMYIEELLTTLTFNKNIKYNQVKAALKKHFTSEKNSQVLNKHINKTVKDLAKYLKII